MEISISDKRAEAEAQYSGKSQPQKTEAEMIKMIAKLKKMAKGKARNDRQL